MRVKIEANAEPIPGYRLIERLGGGGFGEVWKAEAPGGLFKAIKFVFGDLQAADDADGARATQELKALSRVKTVHHPYILSLERYDIIDGQLIIVMELAHRTLWDRFRECRNQGLPGIPRDELLQYMRETAEALDLMNIQFQLQHLDIKPQNLFLVFNHIKVADFGLVKDLGNMAAATVTGGVTPVYAAPETFDGWLSRFSDQYSLAIVFQELLTGQRPFAGSTMRQLVLQHLQGEPDVSSLPLSDRAAVKRALSKNPDDRFPTCVDFVQAIREAAPQPGSNPPQALEPMAPSPPLVDTPVSESLSRAGNIALDVTHLTRGKATITKPAPAKGDRPLEARQALPPRPTGKAAPSQPSPGPSESPPPSAPKSAPPTPLHRRKASNNSEPGQQSGCGGIVQPSLIVGLGKLGVQTLLALRRTLSHEFGHPDSLSHIRMVAIDTDPATLQLASKGDGHGALRSHELVLSRLQRPSHYLNQRDRDGVLRTDSWLDSKFLYRMPKQQNGAGIRALGRLALVDSHRLIAKRLGAELQACAAQDTLHEQVQHTDLGIRTQTPRVYVVTGLAGATGSGMFLDVAYLVRELLRKQGQSRAEVVGLFYLPSTEGQGIRSTALAEAYAALTELQHFASGQAPFSAKYPDGHAPGATRAMTDTGPPFERCICLSLPAPTSATSAENTIPETVTLAGQFLYREIATPFGQAVDTARRQPSPSDTGAGSAPTCQTLGMYRVVWPRKTLLGQAARRLCRRLVDHWMAKDASPIAGLVASWAQQEWDGAELRPENLIARHQEMVEQQLKQTPESMLQAVLNPLVPVLTPPALVKGQAAPPAFNAAPVLTAMMGLDKLLGLPEECRDPLVMGSPVPGEIEQALASVSKAIADACDRQLSELVICLLEAPAYRLAGAEEGLRQFSRLAEHALATHETLTKELRERAASLYQRIQALLESKPQQPLTQSTPVWKLGLGRKGAAPASHFGADLLELMRVYAKSRYQSLILGLIQRLYVTMRGHLSDQIREVGFCRQRLGELGGLVAPSVEPAAPKAEYEKLLLPTDCTTVAEAAQIVDRQIAQDDLVTFDESVQQLICQHYRTLLQVCLGPSNLVRTLAPAMIHEAEKFLTPRFEAWNVADLWLPDPVNDQEIIDALTAAYDEAAPELGKAPVRDAFAVASLPTGAAGQRLKGHVEQALPEVRVVDDGRSDEIVFYRESRPIPLHALEQCGAIAKEAYHQRQAADPMVLHSRNDIAQWQPAAS